MWDSFIGIKRKIMRDYRVEYLKEAANILFLACVITFLIQSCSTTKANLSRKIVEMTKEYPAPGLKIHSPLIRPLDSVKKAYTAIKSVDSSRYFYDQILSNQKIGLLNDQKMLELLLSKEKENKNLKKQNIVLERNSRVSDEVKEDAISMQVLWDLGQDVLRVGMVIIGLLVVVIVLLSLIYNKKDKSALRSN